MELLSKLCKRIQSLGLIAEQVYLTLKSYQSDKELKAKDWEEFISTRVDIKDALKVGELKAYSNRLDSKITNSGDSLCLAIGKTFARRPIICSTSSNMGISLHECIRAFQVKPINIEGSTYSLLA